MDSAFAVIAQMGLGFHRADPHDGDLLRLYVGTYISSSRDEVSTLKHLQHLKDGTITTPLICSTTILLLYTYSNHSLKPPTCLTT